MRKTNLKQSIILLDCSKMQIIKIEVNWITKKIFVITKENNILKSIEN
jgi:hypothetical protein